MTTTAQEFEYRRYLRRKVEQGLADIDRGRVLEQEEVDRQLVHWLGSDSV